MKRTENFYLNSEADFIENCLNLLGIDYTRNDNAKDENDWTITQIVFNANDEQYIAIVKMFSAQ